MNQEYISLLNEMGDLLSRRGETFRSRAYLRASDAIAIFPHMITGVDDIKDVKGIGKTIIANLQEYSDTGRIQALDKERENPLNLLTRVYGIGAKKAQSLLDQGITTLEDLRANTHLLTKASQAGLRHFEDLEERIPRQEIDVYQAVIEHLIPDIKFAIVGSYRRGAKSSGDIDVIITHRDSDIYRQIIDGMLDRKFIVETLSRGKTKCLAISKIAGCRARRIDFLYAPPDEYAFAILYFTGSKTFNTIQRQHALSLGYSLNEHGLTYVHSGAKVKQAFPTEKSIFEFLNMNYVPPHQRNKVINLTGFDPETASEFELANRIRDANHAYYELGEPLMTDAEYDILCSITLRRFPGSTVAGEGHTKTVVERNKVELPYEMWSMDKIKPDTDALAKWRKTFKGICLLSTKLDGVSGLYTTEGGQKRLYTRGNGRVGQDISHLIPHLILPDIADCSIRGEFIMSKALFEEKYSDEFANARNLVAGLINQKVPDPQQIADIDFVAYEVIKPQMRPSDQLNMLVETGAAVVDFHLDDNITNERLSQWLIQWREDCKYAIDGVICCHDTPHQRTSGNPKYAFAFKMVLSEQVAETIVKDVIWAPSKDGYLKPRVQLEPIILGGVTIEYATGFNAQFIEENQIGPGAVVRLVRSGDVIPHITDVVTPAETTAMPTEPFIWNESGVDAVLVNVENDTTVQRKNVTGFFRGIGVEGLSDGNVKRLMDAGYDTTLKIIQMSEADFMEVPGFQAKMAHKLHTGIHERLKATSIAELMHATNLFGRGFGLKKFATIVGTYGSPVLTKEQVEAVPGIAEKSAIQYVEKLPKFITWVADAGLKSKLFNNEITVGKAEDLPLKGKCFVMTGFRDKALGEALIAAGAEATTSVSKNTWLVIMKDANEKTGKAAEARKLGVRIATPDEIKTMLYKDDEISITI